MFYRTSGGPWPFDGCGEGWLFESGGIAGCGKISAACVTPRALGCDDFSIDRIDSRACTVHELRELSERMLVNRRCETPRKACIIDDIQHLSRNCRRMLLVLCHSWDDGFTEPRP